MRHRQNEVRWNSGRGSARTTVRMMRQNYDLYSTAYGALAKFDYCATLDVVLAKAGIQAKPMKPRPGYRQSSGRE
jgi:hypothetical protein